MGIVRRLLSIPSNPEHIRQLETFIEEVTAPYRLDRASYGKILISVTEAVNNAMYHGNHLQPHKEVCIRCHQNGKSIKFWISDEGDGFGADGLPCPTASDRLHVEGGRGVFLMKKLADRIKFRDNGSTVELCFHV